MRVQALALCWLSGVLVGYGLMTQPVWADYYAVTNTADEEYGSLHWAVDQANANSGLDTISFEVSSPVQLPAELPAIIDPVVIEGRGATLTGISSGTFCLLTLSGGSDGSAIRNLTLLQSNRGIAIISSGNHISGCNLGLDWSGAANGLGDGIVVSGAGNLIGGGTPDERNVIAGNYGSGIILEGASCQGNSICGNIIGLDGAQIQAPGNHYGITIDGATNNWIGLPIAGQGNIICGNYRGIDAPGTQRTWNNIIQNNYIGLNLGEIAMPNDSGIYLKAADSYLIGGARGSGKHERNIISGNTTTAIHISGRGNTISGNYIGTNSTGTVAIANRTGIELYGDGNLIGGPNQDADTIRGNIISGNQYGVGIWAEAPYLGENNSVVGNIIGLNAAGNAAIPNYQGTAIGGIHTLIGGGGSQNRNIVSGNPNGGIVFNGTSGRIIGNFIGTDSTGTVPIPNNKGGVLLLAASGTQVGGVTANERNIIVDAQFGIVLAMSEGNTIAGNWVGVLADQRPQGAAYPYGISIMASQGNFIGLKEQHCGNLIAGAAVGVTLTGSACISNGLFSNTICAFGTTGIILAGDGANANKTAPGIIIANSSTVSGTAQAQDYIEVFLADRGSGERGGSLRLIGTANADAFGNWSLAPGALTAGDFICATATDLLNNTSEFSCNAIVTSAASTPVVTLSPTPTPIRITVDFGGAFARVYPNPGRNQVGFVFNVERSANAVVDIYNLAGERLVRLEKTINGSRDALIWDSAGVAPGVYVAWIKIDGNEKGKIKVAIIK